MTLEDIREYCLSKKSVTESFPFNDTALVFKVAGKMFAVLDLSEDKRGISLKCDPDFAVELRERYTEVTPAWHFNKKMWNAVLTDGTVPAVKMKEWIDHSYDEVVNGLPLKVRNELKGY